MENLVSGSRGKGNEPRRQIVLSGVGGQGVLFLSRLLAEAAIAAGFSVLASETHGMAQRGGVVVSHLKVGGFDSPLVRTGRADLLLVLKEENVALHREFLADGGALIVNAPGAVSSARKGRSGRRSRGGMGGAGPGSPTRFPPSILESPMGRDKKCSQC